MKSALFFIVLLYAFPSISSTFQMNLPITRRAIAFHSLFFFFLQHGRRVSLHDNVARLSMYFKQSLARLQQNAHHNNRVG